MRDAKIKAAHVETNIEHAAHALEHICAIVDLDTLDMQCDLAEGVARLGKILHATKMEEKQ